MAKLFNDLNKNRLFTYKVQHDGGSAPNPYKGVCTLAICKPKIRSVANPGDVIVGFACKSNGDDERRIVYIMVVDEVVEWKSYSKGCESGIFKNKIPKNKSDPGDCIWHVSNHENHGWIDSCSGHADDDYERDVNSGKNVLLGSTYWYFGSGDKHSIVVDADINIVPYAQGHRSNANHPFRAKFEKFILPKLEKIGDPGIYGTPSIPCTSDERMNGSSCRVKERESDLADEEDGS